jgi:hypothetical protein
MKAASGKAKSRKRARWWYEGRVTRVRASVFPLTPALSRRERVNLRQPVAETAGFEEPERGRAALPLPAGEGRGEGERHFKTESGPPPAIWVAVFLLTLFAGFASQAADSAVREVAPGIVEVGAVRVDKAARALTFPATVNMPEGIVEYVVVTESGKTHESVFTTRAEPKDIHVAALLLGVRDAAKSTATNQPPALRGDAVRVEVGWESAGEPLAVMLEECARHAVSGRSLASGPWIYNGSELRAGRFAAQAEGSIISIIDDVEALVNNPRPERENDDVWRVNEKVVPPKGTLVRVTLRFAPAPN